MTSVPADLWILTDRTIAHGLNCGALQPLPTHYQILERDGITWLVRVLENVRRKQVVQQTRPRDFNPFLPYDADLFVTNLGDRHVCLLNKFPVFDRHLLIVTREFEAQESWLNASDFAVLWQCLTIAGGLGFYNSGSLAGASQKHKHLQLVPFPVQPDGKADASSIPISGWVTQAIERLAPAERLTQLATVPELPFVHTIAALDPDWEADQAGICIAQRYRQALAAVTHAIAPTTKNETSKIGTAIEPHAGSLTDQPPLAYNLLVTQNWLLLVPRSGETVHNITDNTIDSKTNKTTDNTTSKITNKKTYNISINALGFAGALLVKDAEELAFLEASSPLNWLTQVGFARK